jgi:hypothetical protein
MSDSQGPGPKGPGNEFPTQRQMVDRPVVQPVVQQTGQPTLEPPVHSIDPRDWQTFSRQLREGNVPEERWRWAARIAESLSRDVNLVLINHCPPEPLANHWLRVGHTWFIGAENTMIETNRLVWWRPEWVRDGFERYPSDDPDRVVDRLIALNLGTPWTLPHPRFNMLLAKQSREDLAVAFFKTHALTEIPAEYR